MANYAYMTIEGKLQRLISEGCSTLESIGNRYQAGSFVPESEIKKFYLHAKDYSSAIGILV